MYGMVYIYDFELFPSFSGTLATFLFLLLVHGSFNFFCLSLSFVAMVSSIPSYLPFVDTLVLLYLQYHRR